MASIKRLRLEAAGRSGTERIKPLPPGAVYGPSNRCLDGEHAACGGSFCGCLCHRIADTGRTSAGAREDCSHSRVTIDRAQGTETCEDCGTENPPRAQHPPGCPCAECMSCRW